MDNRSERNLAARLARQLYEKNITFEELLDEYPDDSDDLEINELFDLIEHEPKTGGPLGVSRSRHSRHIDRINELIKRLEI